MDWRSFLRDEIAVQAYEISLHADDGEDRLAIVQVPSNMQRFVSLPIGKSVRFALLDDLVMFFGHRLL